MDLCCVTCSCVHCNNNKWFCALRCSPGPRGGHSERDRDAPASEERTRRQLIPEVRPELDDDRLNCAAPWRGERPAGREANPVPRPAHCIACGINYYEPAMNTRSASPRRAHTVCLRGLPSHLLHGLMHSGGPPRHLLSSRITENFNFFDNRFGLKGMCR